MATTPNFNWSTPDNTGLVKNGALDIRTLGNSIDASLVDLKGGTTGQVLTKATNTDMDFTWATAGSASGPAFNAYRSGTQQSFSQNTWTKVQFNAENFDTDNCFDSTTNYRFTPTKAGYYQFTSAIQISRTGAAASYGAFYKNGAEVSKIYGNTAMPGSTANNGNAFLAYMNGTTDYMEVYVYDSDASARNVQQDAQNSNFTGVWIRS